MTNNLLQMCLKSEWAHTVASVWNLTYRLWQRSDSLYTHESKKEN